MFEIYIGSFRLNLQHNFIFLELVFLFGVLLPFNKPSHETFSMWAVNHLSNCSLVGYPSVKVQTQSQTVKFLLRRTQILTPNNLAEKVP